MQRFFERLLVRDFARHQKAQRFLDARIVGDVDQAFVDDLRACLRRDVGAQVGGRLADRVDIGGGPGTPAELVSAGPPP